MNSFVRAAFEGNKVATERKEARIQREKEREERRVALEESEKKQQQRFRVMSRKNRRGQPHLGGQIGLLLNKIKNDQSQIAQSKKDSQRRDEDNEDDGDNLQPMAEHSDDSGLGVDDFLGDSD